MKRSVALASAFACIAACTASSPVDAPAAGLARTALAAPGVEWDSLVTPSLTLYVQPDTYGGRHREALRDRAEAGLGHALGLLGATRYPARLRIFIIDSREQMAAVTGQSHNGTTDPEAHTVLVVANDDWSPFDRHELMHAASLNLWGEPGSARRGTAEWRRGGWLREGLAAVAEDRCGRYTNRAVAAAMHEQGERLTLPQLFESFYEQDDLAAYMQAGSLVEYLLDTGGRARLRALWLGGSDGLERVYGITIAELEKGWLRWLVSTPADARPRSVAELRRNGCGAGEPPRDG
jgi:hypothetical protein